MNEQEIAASAELFARAHRTGTQFEALPATPASVAEAHAIQDLVTMLLGETVGAFKANTPLNGEPTRATIFARMVRPSPAQISRAEAPHFGVEAEIAFRFVCDLPPRSAPYLREEVTDAVVLLPTIEVVSGRFRDPRTRPRLEQPADFMVNAALIYGEEIHSWSHLAHPNLRVAVVVNDNVVLEHRGGHPTGDPLGVATVLVNLMRGSVGVRARQVVTTGSWSGLRFLKPGDRCVMQFENLSPVEVAFEA